MREREQIKKSRVPGALPASPCPCESRILIRIETFIDFRLSHARELRAETRKGAAHEAKEKKRRGRNGGGVRALLENANNLFPPQTSFAFVSLLLLSLSLFLSHAHPPPRETKRPH